MPKPNPHAKVKYGFSYNREIRTLSGASVTLLGKRNGMYQASNSDDGYTVWNYNRWGQWIGEEHNPTFWRHLMNPGALQIRLAL